MDVVRDILMRIERQTVEEARDYLVIDELEPTVQEHHMNIMLDAGLISANDWATHDRELGHRWGYVRLTWKGHELLDSVRDPKVWSRTKEGVQKAGGFSLEVLQELAKAILLSQIEKYTGFKISG
ncbi:MAG: DUF2513 domain-containing protein [Pseudomonadota bacterium]